MWVFFGTSQRSALFLEKAYQEGLKFDLVVSQPAQPLGRKKTLTENPTITTAKKLQIPFSDKMEDLKKFPGLAVGFILDFQKIVPSSIINLFQKGIINVHFSKLPEYIGPAPVQATILNGDQQAWITYYLIDENLDRGKVIFQSALNLSLKETTESLYYLLIEKVAKESFTIISQYLEEKITPQPQKGKSSYTQKLTTANCQIDWSKKPQEIERLIRAAYKEPGAFTFVNLSLEEKKAVKRIKVLKSHLDKGKLILDLVQLEGKNPVTWKQFKQGYPEIKFV